MAISESDLNTIKGFMHYANDLKDDALVVDIKFSDSNGEVLGSLVKEQSGEYEFEPVTDHD
jgi:hypothetical protein